MSKSNDKPEIIIDEDWKQQIERERETTEARRAEGEKPPTTEGAARPSIVPPASLILLFTTLATQAMMALGQFPNPLTGKRDVHLDQAKHFIDTLSILETKTEGNRTPEESDFLTGALHQLRMDFVQASAKK